MLSLRQNTASDTSSGSLSLTINSPHWREPRSRVFTNSATLVLIKAILFEYIDQVDLSQYVVSSNEELERIQSKGDSALAKIHVNQVYQVYHSDIRAENILWISSTERIVIFDFYLPTVFFRNEHEDVVELRKRDRDALEFTLRYKVRALGRKVRTGRKRGPDKKLGWAYWRWYPPFVIPSIR
jgi:hypothetical protein